MIDRTVSTRARKEQTDRVKALFQPKIDRQQFGNTVSEWTEQHPHGTFTTKAEVTTARHQMLWTETKGSIPKRARSKKLPTTEAIRSFLLTVPGQARMSTCIQLKLSEAWAIELTGTTLSAVALFLKGMQDPDLRNASLSFSHVCKSSRTQGFVKTVTTRLAGAETVHLQTYTTSLQTYTAGPITIQWLPEHEATLNREQWERIQHETETPPYAEPTPAQERLYQDLWGLLEDAEARQTVSDIDLKITQDYGTTLILTPGGTTHQPRTEAHDVEMFSGTERQSTTRIEQRRNETVLEIDGLPLLIHDETCLVLLRVMTAWKAGGRNVVHQKSRTWQPHLMFAPVMQTGEAFPKHFTVHFMLQGAAGKQPEGYVHLDLDAAMRTLMATNRRYLHGQPDQDDPPPARTVITP